MKATRPLLLLALLALLGSCSKATDEPVSPNKDTNNQPLTLDLSGEIEFPNHATPQKARELLLKEGTSPSGKRIISPSFNDKRLPAILCFYDDFGAMYISRVHLDVTRATGSQGGEVSRFRFHGALDQSKFKPRSADQSAALDYLTYKTDPSNSGIYVALFIGLDPIGRSEEKPFEVTFPSVTYTHAGKGNTIGVGIDYTSKDTEQAGTRLIFGTMNDRTGTESVEIAGAAATRDVYKLHRLNFVPVETSFDKAKDTPKQDPKTFNHVLSLNTLKLRMYGVLLEATIENQSATAINVEGIRVGGFGGKKAKLAAPVSERVTRTNAQGQKVTEWRVTKPLTLMPDGFEDYDINFATPVPLVAKDSKEGLLVSPPQLVYLPFVGEAPEKKPTLKVFYTLKNDPDTKQPAQGELMRSLNKQGVLVTKQFSIK